MMMNAAAGGNGSGSGSGGEYSNAADAGDAAVGASKFRPWTVVEERRLYLAVRALMPAKKSSEGRGGGGGISTSGGATMVEAAGRSSSDTAGEHGAEASQGQEEKDEGGTEGEESGVSPKKRKRMPTETVLGEARRLQGYVPRYEELHQIEWAEVAKLMKNSRRDEQCREKWFGTLDPFVERGEWTEEEDEALMLSEKI